jgi:formylglycine-generating enzyme required for sulfatase activity
MNMLETMDLKSSKKFLSSITVSLLLCITPFSFQFCQKINLENVPRFKVNRYRCNVSEVITVNDTNNKAITFEMVFVEGGTFLMGAQKDDKDGENYDSDAPATAAKPVHSVTLSDYYISNTEVTQALWFTVMNDSYTGQTSLGDGYSLTSTNGLGANYPVYNVSWDDIVGKSAGSKDSFDVGGIFYYDNGFCYKLSVLVNGGSLGSRRFSLPTEEEWEYAARGGNKSQSKQGKGSDYKFSGSNTATDVAWHVDNNGKSDSDTTYGAKEVGRLLANELGLYDMSGNVFEWCADTWRSSYDAAYVPTKSRPVRGGYWNIAARLCCVFNRVNYPAHNHLTQTGFRVRCGS